MAEVLEDSEVITATAASRQFSELLHRVCYGGESFVIKKGQRLMARIMPIEAIKEEEKQSEERTPETLRNAIIEALGTEIAEENTFAPSDEAEFYRAWIEQVRNVKETPIDI